MIYLETIRQSSMSEGKYIRQTGGHGNYGHVKLTLEPIDPVNGIEFIRAISEDVIPKQFIEAAERGIRNAASENIVTGRGMAGIPVIKPLAPIATAPPQSILIPIPKCRKISSNVRNRIDCA